MRAQTTILAEFMQAIGEAIGCSSQILHVWRDTRWALIRETLLKIKSASINMAIKPN